MKCRLPSNGIMRLVRTNQRSAADRVQGLRRRSSGQILLLFAIAMVALVSATSMVFDFANLYLQKVKLQSATDSAALAGAGYLPPMNLSDTRSTSTASSYALSNGVTAAEVQSIVVAGDSNSLTVTTSRNVPAYFAQVLGFKQFIVKASATAGVQTIGKNVSGAMPVGLDDTTTYTKGQSITLHGGGVGPGNWGSLALGCTGASCLQANLTNGYSGQLSVGDVVNTEPGATKGPVQKAINDRISNGLAADPGGTWSEHTLTDPRSALVPLVTWGGVNGSATVPISAFAEVWISSVSGTDISAVFIAQVVSGQAVTGARNAGVLHVALLQ